MMPSPPRVSVVMIFFNAARHMSEAIASVEGQAFESWELILVDDGSTDGSRDIAMAAVQRAPGKIRYVNHPGAANLGMSASRNRGIQEARADLIAFLDADDVWLPQKLEHHIACLDANPDAAMAYGATTHWHSWTGDPRDAGRDQPRRLGVTPNTIVKPPTLAVRFLTGEAQTPGTCGIIVRRSAVLAVGGFDAAFRGMFEDAVFVYRICLRYPVFVDDARYDLYRQHAASHVRMARTRGRYSSHRPNESTRIFLEWLAAHIAECGIRDSDLDAQLNRARAPYRDPLRNFIRGRVADIRYGVSRLAGFARRLLGSRGAIT